jgi:hypothetical protein
MRHEEEIGSLLGPLLDEVEAWARAVEEAAAAGDWPRAESTDTEHVSSTSGPASQRRSRATSGLRLSFVVPEMRLPPSCASCAAHAPVPRHTKKRLIVERVPAQGVPR